MDGDIPNHVQITANLSEADTSLSQPPPTRTSTPVPPPQAMAPLTDQPKTALNIRLPPFTRENAASRFYTVEGQSRMADLNDEVLKADIAINALLEEIYKKIAPWLMMMSVPTTFQELKSTLVETAPCRSLRELSVPSTSPSTPSRKETSCNCGMPSRKVLQRLQESGLIVRFDKCTFGIEKVEFLGHEISLEGVRPMSSKVKAVEKFPTPTSIRAVQEFLGMVNCYRRFIPGTAHAMAPLMEVLKGCPKTLVWGPDQQKAFLLTKASLVKATSLAHQDPSAPLQLTTDTSNVACGAVLEQVIRGTPQPIAFFSRRLNPTESCYSTFNRELFAAYQVVRHFKFLLEGTPFTIL